MQQFTDTQSRSIKTNMRREIDYIANDQFEAKVNAVLSMQFLIGNFSIWKCVMCYSFAVKSVELKTIHSRCIQCYKFGHLFAR